MSIKELITRLVKNIASVEIYDVANKVTGVNTTVQVARLYVFAGRVAMLYLWLKLTANRTANAETDLATLDYSLRPITFAGLGSGYGAGGITEQGNVRARPQYALSSGGNFYCTSTYILLNKYPSGGVL